MLVTLFILHYLSFLRQTVPVDRPGNDQVTQLSGSVAGLLVVLQDFSRQAWTAWSFPMTRLVGKFVLERKGKFNAGFH